MRSGIVHLGSRKQALMILDPAENDEVIHIGNGIGMGSPHLNLKPGRFEPGRFNISARRVVRK
jgi:hypothetical protein